MSSYLEMKGQERHNLHYGLQNGIQKKEILKKKTSFIAFVLKS